MTRERFSVCFLLALSALLERPAFAQSGVAICNRIGSAVEQQRCLANLAGRAVAPAAVTLCNRIGTSKEAADCAGVVAGRTVDANAVNVCGRVGQSAGVVDCARAIVDKEYGPDELSLCGQQGATAGLVNCMRSAGRRRAAPRPFYPQSPAPRARYASVEGTWRSTSGSLVTILDSTSDFSIVLRTPKGAQYRFQAVWSRGRFGREFSYLGNDGQRFYGYFDDRRPDEIRLEGDNETFWWRRS